MNKEETLVHLRNAKKAHITWVQRAHALIEGLPIEKEQVPVGCTECKFGLWFYGEGQALGMIPNMDCLKEIEKLHYELHDIYMKIFKIYFSDDDRSLFSKLFGTRKKISAVNQEVAEEYYHQLKAVSERLVEGIDRLERRLFALQENTFVKLA
ncbi:MAG: CZB domain-containing protein [Sulfuricurvum sp.]|uniref:CZB domain-containing protein n=1 Tax=Sulfuricurvum sp. TaxID=2025608 RepID=UPI00263895B8|nr:CZB domain-containing protein [Sulfuricurvum sp.]MDD2830092.1 CZB domain-containing protein [Sulfuricurvum sp.]MDD4949927.1 CZB domain-containing protein [Sulfuricurvum sp.]